MTANVIGIAPMSATVDIEGTVIPNDTREMIMTPPALLAPAANPVPLARMSVG
jgi:hypothetical protein